MLAIATTKQPEETPQDFRRFLQNELHKRCQKHTSYSVSSFARFLKTDVSALSKILKGTRPVKSLAIERLGKRLGLNPIQLESFKAASPRANAKDINPRTPESSYQQLTLDAFILISDWYHNAILELMNLPHFRGEPRWIAKTLAISPTEAQIAIERLLRLEIIEIKEDGKWTNLTSGKVSSITKKTNDASLKLQKQVLEKALRALDEVPFERRSQTTLTSAIDPSKIPEAKEMIIDFQRKLCQFLRTDNRKNLKEVYNLSISLYPLTNTQHSTKESP